MKPRLSKQRISALTLVEVMTVVVVLAILAVILLQFLYSSYSNQHNSRSGVQRIRCISNLKQIGISFRLWENDHNDQYPMQVSVTNGGAMELAARGNVAAGFLVMSNELSTPKILWCPADAHGIPAANFSNLNNSNISYFTGLDAEELKPLMLLSGDDNFAIGGVPAKSGLLELSTNITVAWASGRHSYTAYNSHFWTPARYQFFGNLGMADGSVQQVTTDDLQKALQQTGVATNRLVIP